MLDFIVKLVGIIRRLCILLTRVGEAAQSLKANIFSKLGKLLKLFLGLPGEARNKGGAENNVRNSVFDFVEQRCEAFSVAAAVHPLQNFAVAVLQRNINVFNDLILARDNVNQLVGHAVGIAVKQSYPAESVNLAKLGKKLGGLRFAVQILTVSCCVLSNNVKLNNALCGKLPCLLKHILNGTAAEFSPDKRNGAIGTAVVAALRNL